MRVTPRILLVAALAAATAACGGGDGPELDVVLADLDPDTPIATLERGGGFVPMEFELTRVPDVVVYGDGSVLAARGDGVFSRFELPDDELRELVHDLAEADLGRFPTDVEAVSGAGNIADAHSVVIAVRLDGDEHRISAYALGLEGVRYPEAIEAVAARLDRLNERVHERGARWVPERGRLLVTGSASPEVPAEPWPDDLPVPAGLAGASFEDPATLVLDGPQVETAAAAFAPMPTRPLRAPGGQAYVVSWRPLLPHEAPEE